MSLARRFWFSGVSLAARLFDLRHLCEQKQKHVFRPRLESLDERIVPAVFTVNPGDTATLIADINTANFNGDPSNTINISGTYDLTAINTYWYGPDGLPAIYSNLTISGDPAT